MVIIGGITTRLVFLFVVIIHFGCISTKKEMLESHEICDLIEVSRIEKEILKLELNDFMIFFNILDSSCKSNIEFSQYYSEVLFKLLEGNPSLFVGALSKLGKEKFDLLLDELADPVMDVNKLKLVESIKSVEGNENVKVKVINVLKKLN